MRVFVAGASGAIGTRLVPQLIDAGHEVIGTSTSSEGAKRVRALGAKPIALDLLDAGAVRRAVLASEPEAIVHQATALADLSDLKQRLRGGRRAARARPRAAGLQRVRAGRRCDGSLDSVGRDGVKPRLNYHPRGFPSGIRSRTSVASVTSTGGGVVVARNRSSWPGPSSSKAASTVDR